ncbi:MAG: methionyl-tRNA formyltransferase, partial [Polyangiaceae bacterium]
GRGQKLRPTPVKTAAKELGLPVLEPQRPREIIADLEKLDADAFAVASYGRILPHALLDLPRLGAFNVHPSLLPFYRGATPLQAQIRDLCTTTGVTIMKMDAGMDTGDILLQEQTPLGSRETYGELEARLADLGAQLLARVLEIAERGKLKPVPQDDLASPEATRATLTRPLHSSDLRIDWTRSATFVDAFVRSLSPQPAARGSIGGVACKIVAVHPIEGDGGAPGSLVRMPRGVAVTCAEGAVAIDRVIPANRSVMSGEAFAASLFAAEK